jgi:uncharacterized protein (DUF983 family)
MFARLPCRAASCGLIRQPQVIKLALPQQTEDSLLTVTSPMRRQPDRAGDPPARGRPPLLAALKRGLRGRCPVCGQATLFNGYLRVRVACPHCAAPLGRVRADDVPPYFTILVVGHIVVPGMLVLERVAAPPIWVQTVLWVPLTLILTLVLLRPIKGAIVGTMLAFGLLPPASDAGA